MEPKMGFKAVKFCFFLTEFLLCFGATSIKASLYNSNTTSSPLLRTELSSCVFPKFLQTNCTISAGVCKWNLGKRIALPRWHNLSPPSMFRAIRGTSEWTWTVVNSIITVKRTIYTPNSQLPSSITHEVFCCLTDKNLSDNRFIISKKEAPGENLVVNVSYSCIRFLKRSETVIQYEIGSWKRSLKDVSCQNKELILQDNLLISDHSRGLHDCPLKLRGAYEIILIQDAEKQRVCTYSKGSFGLLESDCISKEGIYIDFGTGHNCTNPDIGNRFPLDLNLQCISKEWNDNTFTYFVTARRTRWLSDYEKTTIQCMRFKTTSDHGDELTLTIFNEPICKEVTNNRKSGHMFSLRIRRRKTEYFSEHLSGPGNCKFPNEFQGSWTEQSKHQGSKKITIEGGNISISPYGSFECKERFTLGQGHPSVCGFGAERDQWLGQGQVRFYYDDYLIISRFNNSCRARVTRLGLTNTVNKRVLIYRLSHSEPFVGDQGKSTDDIYRHEILKRFCGMPYLYQRDPFPYWGRNIEKVIHKEDLRAQSMSKCSLALNSRYGLLSVIAGTHSTSCPGITSNVHFGCQEQNTQAMTYLKIFYNPICKKNNVAFTCIGKAWKFGNYILLRDAVTQQINCIWFDKEHNAIFRLETSQCSDSSWGRLPGHDDQFNERFQIEYFDKCPFVQPVGTAKTETSAAAVTAVNQIIWLLPWILAGCKIHREIRVQLRLSPVC